MNEKIHDLTESTEATESGNTEGVDSDSVSDSVGDLSQNPSVPPLYSVILRTLWIL